MAIHLELETLYMDDKRDRQLFDNGQLSEDDLILKDTYRQQKLRRILPTIDEMEIWNCHYACFLLMHTPAAKPAIYQLAHEYAKKALSMGSTVTGWLYAASLDRWLISQGKPQKFGTQYDIKTGTILEHDSTTTDAQRAEYGVPPLSELMKRQTH